MYPVTSIKNFIALHAHKTPTQISPNTIKSRHSYKELITSAIYAIYCHVNDKFYIGSSKNCLQRLKRHSYNLIRNTHHSMHLQNTYNAYGLDSLEFVLITWVDPRMFEDRTALKVEDYYLNEYDIKNNGLNVSLTASGAPTLSEETTNKIKIGNARKAIERKKNKRLPYDQLLSLAEKQFTYIDVYSPEYKFIQGKRYCHLVDAEDYSKLIEFNWLEDKNGKAIRVGNIFTNNSLQQFYLTKDILQTNEIIKFRNGVRQDCRKSNLITKSNFYKENNKIKYINYSRNDKSYVVTLFINGNSVRIGQYKLLDTAIFFRDCAIKYFHINEPIIDTKSVPLSQAEIKLRKRLYK